LYKQNRLACLFFQTLIALHHYLSRESQPQGLAPKLPPLQSPTTDRLPFALVDVGASQSAHLLLFASNFLLVVYLREDQLEDWRQPVNTPGLTDSDRQAGFK
jgi:hypothetical protein